MSKAEEFIQNYTRNCSNEILSPYPQINNDIRRIDGEPAKEFSSWLTPDQARNVAEIAREETIKEVCELIRNNILEYCSTTTEIDIETFIYDMKKILEDKI